MFFYCRRRRQDNVANSTTYFDIDYENSLASNFKGVLNFYLVTNTTPRASLPLFSSLV